jgi:murein DD-endopeptidase MepM/ murein hydrolase activator NlpD
MNPAEALLAAVLLLGGEAGAPQGQLAQPVVHARVSSDYGIRVDPLHGRHAFHEGIDLAASIGSIVRAVAPGQVIFSGYHAGYGRVIALRHNDEVTTLYAHCWAVRVTVGDRVQAGSILGFVGESGRATGPHLHFEIRINGKSLDPLALLKTAQP